MLRVYTGPPFDLQAPDRDEIPSQFDFYAVHRPPSEALGCLNPS